MIHLMTDADKLPVADAKPKPPRYDLQPNAEMFVRFQREARENVKGLWQ